MLAHEGKLISDHGLFSSYECKQERRTGRLWMAGCWLERWLRQLKASSAMDLGTVLHFFLIFLRGVTLKNLGLLIKTLR